MERATMTWRRHAPWLANCRGRTRPAPFHSIQLLAARLISAGSAAVITLATAAPLLEHLRAPVAQRIYWLLSFICHQIPSRSPMVLGSNMGLCFRCTAIYAALAVGAALPLGAVVRPIARVFKPVLRLNLNHLTAAMAGLLILLLFVDGLLPMLGWPLSTNPRRIITGLLGGWAIASLLVITTER